MVPLPPFEAPRPPTPPKETNRQHDSASPMLKADCTLDSTPAPTVQQFLGIDTPPPQPSPSSIGHSNQRGAKKVDFSPWPPSADHTTISGTPSLKRLPLSKCLKPRKSILKAISTPTPSESGSPAPDYFSIEKPQTFQSMLEAVVKLLASSSPALRLDGYQTLNGALKAYQDLPDAAAIRTKMTLLVQFITRDLTTRSIDTVDTNLMTQALKLTTALATMPQLADTFSDDFQILLMDRAIDVMGQEGVTKATANHYMYMLACQRFGSKAVTPSRVDQIITRLDTVHTRVSGNSVIASRLVIYQRLLDQSPTVMLARIRDWLKHIFHGVMSSTNDVRTRALECGSRAGLALGTTSAATKALLDLFDTEINDGGTYGEYLSARLSDMIRQRDKSPFVPQIWAMVVIFFRSRKRKITHWPMFKRLWLLIIQKCLNSSDITTKFHATIAWNRLVFVINPDQSTLDSMEALVPMLKVPFTVAFDKKGQDRHTREARRIANAGYCNLLYYSLRPSQSHQELDAYWDHYAHPVLSKLLKSGGKEAKFACRVLKALLRGNAKAWDANRANEAAMLTPEDLPRIDPKWIRLRLAKVIAVLEPYLSACLCAVSEVYAIETTPWPDLLAAVAEAGSQEVRASLELREALAHLMNLFFRLWSDASKNFKVPSDHVWITKFGTVLQPSIETLGPLHFGEEILNLNQSEAFEAAPTPSHRSSKHHESLQAPIVCLVGLFRKPPVTVESDMVYYAMVSKALQSVCAARPSHKSRLMLLRQCTSALVAAPGEVTVSDTEAKIWCLIAANTSHTLSDQSRDTSDQETYRLGHQARQAVLILSNGLSLLRSAQAVSSHKDLYHTISQKLKTEAGEGAVALDLMEPVAEALSNAAPSMPISVLLMWTTMLLVEGVWPKSRQQIDDARRVLSGAPLNHSRHAVFEPFDHVYKLINTTSSIAYNHMLELETDFTSFVVSVEGFLGRCPTVLATTALRKTQSGLALFVQDKEKILTSTRGASQQASLKVLSLWQTVLRLTRSSPASSLLLRALEELFAAGLSSSKRGIVNATIQYWNETFGQLDRIEYPQSIEIMLRKLRSVVELDLPTFPDSMEQDVSSIDLPFMLSQEDSPQSDRQTPKIKTLHLHTTSSTPKTVDLRRSARQIGNVKASPIGPKQRASTPTSARRNLPSDNTPKARLRHDDSQVQFVAVQSSPIDNSEMESQNLTDHQKEVLGRQQLEAAQMYPDFSSSPAATASPKKRPSLPRIDFTPRARITEPAPNTPEALQDDHDLMDDYLGSSPTPRGAEKFEARPDDFRHEDPHAAAEELPSSPPEAPDDMNVDDVTAGAELEAEHMPVPEDNQEDDATIADPTPSLQLGADAQAGGLEAAMTSDERSLEARQRDPFSTDEGTTEIPTGWQMSPTEAIDLSHEDLVTDEGGADPLPGTELQQMNESGDDQSALAAEPVFPTQDLGERSSSPVQFEDSLVEQPLIESAAEHEEIVAQVVENDVDPAGGDVTRIEDSFDESVKNGRDRRDVTLDGADQGDNSSKDLEEDVQAQAPSSAKSNTSSQRSSERTKKRKRLPEVGDVPTTKRRKQESPIKRLYSRIFGGSQPSQEEDDTIEDCIVVASQPVFASKTETAFEHPERMSAPPESTEPLKSKRARGRPRKSATPVSDSPARVHKSRLFKRRSDVIDDDDISGDVTRSDVSLVEDTPAPSKVRRQRLEQDVKTAQSLAQESDDDNEAPLQSATRKLHAVIIPASNINHDEYEYEHCAHEGRDVEASPERQLRQEQEDAVARSSRHIAKPKSIMEKLKGILADCKNMMLGSQEERDMDDMLFEVRKEVHEAGRRGRDF